MRKITFLSLIISLFTFSTFAQACMDTENDGDLSYTASVDGGGINYLTVTPTAGFGDPTFLLFFNVNGAVSGANSVTEGIPFEVTSARQSTDGNVYFYYLYSMPGGGEKNTIDDNFSFPYDTCPTLSNDSFTENNFENSLTLATKGENIELSGLSQEVNIAVYNLVGQLKSTSSTNQSTHEIATSNLSKGIYLVQVTTKDGKQSKAIKVAVN